MNRRSSPVAPVVVEESAVSKHISPGDQLFGGGDYFGCGRSAVECIRKALDTASISPDQIKHILDLPCGHGRVLRYLKAGFPEAKITACDLLRDGVDFCSSAFGATGIYSCDEPEAIPLEAGSFELIWVGSLFTHLDAPLWARFLGALREALCPGGLLVFSTHGRTAYQRIVSGMNYGIGHWRTTQLLYRYERTGFGYAKYSGSESYYGLSLSHPAWVARQLTALGGFRLINLSERAWEQFQDVFACIREPDCEGDMLSTSGVRYSRHLALDRMHPRLRSVLGRVWRWWF